MLKIWGRINSINVQKVVLCAEDIGVKFERIDAGAAFGKNKTAEYLAMNPNGLVPVIEDGAHALWESNAIVRYLCAKYSAGKHWPADAAERSVHDQWMEWQATTLTPAMHPAFWALIRTPVAERDPAVIEASREKAEVQFDILEARLAGNEWVAGRAHGMGDLCLLPAVHRWLGLPLKRVARPHVARWYEAAMKRPSSGKVLSLPIT